MKNNQFADFMIEYTLTINDFLEQALTERVNNVTMQEILKYSALAPGKRIRPLLFLATLSELNVAITEEHIKVAGGIELIHTYSLIHDDLPAMDNDDLRRGQLTSHKKFGEANAILAGDALLTMGLNWITYAKLPADVLLQSLRTLTDDAGVNGMVGGQFLDVNSTKTQVTTSEVAELEYLKTAKLIMAAVKMGAIIGHADAKQTASLVTFSENFGRAFQVYDDLVDAKSSQAEEGKLTGKDLVRGKNNFVTKTGVQEATVKLRLLIEQIDQSLENFHADLLKGFSALFTKVLADD